MNNDTYILMGGRGVKTNPYQALNNLVLFEENQKLKQTLTEIKEICKTGIVHGLSADEYATSLNVLKFNILQKISEVIDEI